MTPHFGLQAWMLRKKRVGWGRIVSEQTSATLRHATGLDGGSGKTRTLRGRIGGKTATSEQANAANNLSSFIGFAPADDPQVIALCHQQSAGLYYGGLIAAPVVKGIFEILPYLGIEKTITGTETEK